MTRAVKTIFLWLLIAALPVQGMAAVIKASCAPQHHGFSQVVMHVAEHEDHHHGDSASHQHASHQHHLPDPALAASGPDLADPSADGSSSTTPFHASSYCSACAACCVGAVAPPSAVSLAPVFRHSEAVIISPALSYSGFIPPGLERPPRHLSA